MSGIALKEAHDLRKAEDEMKKFREYLDAPPTDEEILDIMVGR